MNELNSTRDVSAFSWLESANRAGCDFPIQNLPHGVFRRMDRGGGGAREAFRGAVAIGDQVLDLAAAAAGQHLEGLAQDAARAAALPALNDFFAIGPAAWRALRHALFGALKSDAPLATAQALRGCLVPQAEVEFSVPARIGDYTDFYTSLDHALNTSRLMNPDGDVTPNFRWVPTAYHGRASTIGVSDHHFRRPMSQAMVPGARRRPTSPA